jgi:hypothetical protein
MPLSTDGLTNLFVRRLASDPTTPSTLVAGTDGNGVFVITVNQNQVFASQTGRNFTASSILAR